MSSTQNSDEDVYLFASQLSCSSVLPMAVRSAIELDLFEIIAKAGPGALLSPTEIASQLPTTNPDAPSMLDRILRLLASYSVLTCSSRTLPDEKFERLYGLAPVCKFYIKNEDVVPFASLSLMVQDKIAMEGWYHLKDAVLEGGSPFHRAHEMTIFDYQNKDPRFKKIFNNSMSSHSTIMTKKILETYKGFEGLQSLVDVGGGTGTILNLIISKYPSIKGINFDLPHIIQDSPSYPGVEHVGGDMFLSVPKGDSIFMKGICHDWNDEQCLKILKNCYEALPNDGKVIVCDRIIPVLPDSSPESREVFHLDCIMLIHCHGGMERTENEFRSLAIKSGFQRFQVVCRAFNSHIMEFLKKA